MFYDILTSVESIDAIMRIKHIKFPFFVCHLGGRNDIVFLAMDIILKLKGH